jgi:multicomponent Na+:H+ antiporter subunit G
MIMGEILSFAAGILVVLGSLFCMLAALGIVRMPDLYTRMHTASKAGAVGTGLVFAAVALISQDSSVVLRAVAGIAFVLLTTPVSAHLLARAARIGGYKPTPLTVVDEFRSNTEKQL